MKEEFMDKAELGFCALCGRTWHQSKSEQELIWVPMRFSVKWALYKVHKKCEDKHQKIFGGTKV